jgi:hypothetical protein
MGRMTLKIDGRSADFCTEKASFLTTTEKLCGEFRNDEYQFRYSSSKSAHCRLKEGAAEGQDRKQRDIEDNQGEF